MEYFKECTMLYSMFHTLTISSFRFQNMCTRSTQQTPHHRHHHHKSYVYIIQLTLDRLIKKECCIKTAGMPNRRTQNLVLYSASLFLSPPVYYTKRQLLNSRILCCTVDDGGMGKTPPARFQ